MEKCPECSFKKVQKVTERDPETKEVIRTASVCKNCGHVLRETEYEEE